MATETETSQAPEGQQPPAQDPAQGQEPADTDILSELASLTDEGEPAQEAPAAEEPAEGEPEGDGEAKSGEQEESEAEEGESEEEGKEAASEETPAEEPEQDAETQRRIEKVQEAEKRKREAIAREKQQAEQEIQRQWQELQPHIQEAQQFRELQQRAQVDPGAVAEALNLPEHMNESLAKFFYSRTEKGRKDPRLREQALHELRQNKQSSEVQELRTELQQLRQEREQEKQRQVQEQNQARYLDAIEKATTDDTPLIKTWMGKNQSKAKSLLLQTAQELYREYGEVPEPPDVVKRAERNRRAELEELGIDPDAALKKGGGDKTSQTKTETQTADKTKTAKTLTNDLGGTTQPRSEPATDEELDAEILRDLSQGKLE